jgi:CheY-like chemotaxis protein
MSVLLLVSKDSELKGLVEGVASTGWKLLEATSPAMVIQILQGASPSVMVADMHLVGVEGLNFLDAVCRRTDPPLPLVLVAPATADASVRRKANSLKALALLERPVSAEDLEEILAPFAPVEVPVQMSLLECLGAGFTDLLTREIILGGESGSLSLLFGRGSLWSIRHPMYPERYVQVLKERGLEVDLEEGDPWLSLAGTEERLGPSPALFAAKQSVILSTLAGCSPHQPLEVRTADVVIPEGLLPVDIPSLLVSLMEHAPEESLEVLWSPGFRVRLSGTTIPEDLAIRPEHGFILSQCAERKSLEDLSVTGILSRKQVGAGVYLLCMLGLLSAEPEVPPPFRLDGLRTALREEEGKIRRQSEAILSLLRSLQVPGQNPYQILGVPADTSPAEAQKASEALLRRLSPEMLHPEVYRRHQKDLLLIRAKANEAQLLIQTAYFQSRRGEAEPSSESKAPSPAGGSASIEGRKAEAVKMLGLARDYLEQDQAYEASQYLKVALFHDPASAPAHFLMAKVYERNPSQRARHMAEREYLQATQLDPKNIDYLLDLAEFYKDNGLLARCRAFLDKAQAIELRHPRALSIRKAIKGM